MAENIADDLTYFLQLDVQNKDFLSPIRHWNNLKVGIEEGSIWVKNFTEKQLGMVELKSIPFATLYYSKDNYLFPAASLLPARKVPSLLWSPADRALPIKLEGFNHNLFEIPGQIKIRLVPSEDEQQACALLTDSHTAGCYIEKAPAFRLNPLSWAVIGNNQIFIKGEPLLPLNGSTYWQRGSFIYPVGFMPEFGIMEAIAAREMDSSRENLIWWRDEHHYSLLPVAAMQPLSIASWRLTMEKLTHKNGVEL
jgi:MoxR-vWA-beta-propeller ternary system domain bpX2